MCFYISRISESAHIKSQYKFFSHQKLHVMVAVRGKRQLQAGSYTNTIKALAELWRLAVNLSKWLRFFGQTFDIFVKIFSLAAIIRSLWQLSSQSVKILYYCATLLLKAFFVFFSSSKDEWGMSCSFGTHSKLPLFPCSNKFAINSKRYFLPSVSINLIVNEWEHVCCIMLELKHFISRQWLQNDCT